MINAFLIQENMEKLKPIEHKFKSLFYLSLKGILSDRAGNTSRALDVSQMKRVIIFRPDRLGDMVITLPLVDALKQFFPHLKISILASPKNIGLIKDDKRFDKVFLYSKNIWRLPGELLKVKKEKFDCIIDTVFEDSVTTLYLTHYCASGKPIVGMGKKRFSRYYDLNFDNTGGHIIDNTLKLVNAFGIDSSKAGGYTQPWLSQSDLERASKYFGSFGQPGSYQFKVGLNLSSGAPSRVWQKEKWIDLISLILKIMPESQLILITVPAEKAFAENIKALFPERVHVVPDNLDILGVSAIIKNLDLLVTPDTSLVHIARAFHVPVAGLYTRFAKNFNLWHPYGMKEEAIRAVNEDNIFDITVAQVMDKIQSLVKTGAEVNR